MKVCYDVCDEDNGHEYDNDDGDDNGDDDNYVNYDDADNQRIVCVCVCLQSK